MKLDIKKIKSMNIDELYSVFCPTIDLLRKEYNYVNFSKYEYLSIMKDGVNTIIKKTDNELEFIDISIFEECIKNIINKQIQEKLKSKQTCFNIIDSYIKKNIEYLPDNQNINELDKINKFLISFNYFPDFDLYINLIENNQIINNILNKFVQENLNLIENGEIHSLIKDDISTSFIEAYCMINNIKMKSDYDNIDDLYTNIDLESYDENIKIYLKEIDKPLLTPEEEKRLAYSILNGNEEAKKIFIERNLKLVVNIAKNYVGKGLQLLDLIQEGNIALIDAVNKFDVTKGYKFSTYATNCIKNKIKRAIHNKGRNIRISVKMHEKLAKYNRTRSDLEKKLNREPTLKEISEVLKISLKKIEELYKLQNDTISLNYLIENDDDDAELIDFIPDPNQVIDKKLMENSLKLQVRKLLENCDLNSREIDILMLRFDFNGKGILTLKEIGKKYNCTRENIRRLEAKAIRKLRELKETKYLAVYMNNPEKAIENLEYYKEQGKSVKNKYKKL